ncbi:hypothetical protein GCM10009764_27710 [Nocardia ninae]|uniref:Uncharacterized protein n=1 Tax=Nocardia ninae NBRC 108245 TaxID=1210091 RepID=A0A511MM62_9NOCA|nr:hypothetical protein NN4_57460 [Nocardia ninae NBRC 108245]
MRRGCGQRGGGGEPLGQQIQLSGGSKDDLGLYVYVANHDSTPSSGGYGAEPREFPLRVIGRDSEAIGSIESPEASSCLAPTATALIQLDKD